MSQIASFYLLKGDQREELPDGGASGDVYMAIWDYCEGELDIDGRFNAPQTDDTLDCVLIDGEMAAKLLEELRAYDLTILAHQIAPDWNLPAQAVRSGLETILSHLEQVRGDTALLYEMV